MKTIFISGCLFLLLLSFPVHSQDIPKNNCSLIDPGRQVISVFFGWPVKISCSVFDDLADKDYDDIEEHGAKCLLWNLETGQLLLNESVSSYYDLEELFYMTSDFSANSSVLYEINYILNGVCSKINIFINASNFVQQTCEQALNVIPTFTERPTIGLPYTIFCPGDSGEFSVRWFRNCGNVSSTLTETGNSFSLPKVDRQHAGSFYTCAYVYNQMTQYLHTTKLCLRLPKVPGSLSLLCSQNKYSAELGENVDMECSVNLGTGKNTLTGFAASWVQLPTQDVSTNLTTCVNLKNSTQSAKDNKIICSWNLIQSMSAPCFENVPTEDELIASASIVTLKLQISDVQLSDLGKYSLLFRVNSDNSVNETLTLELNVVPSLIKKAKVVGICIGILVCLLILMALVYWKLFYFKLYFRRKFGKFQEDNKVYGAFLSYQYSKTEIDSFAQQVTKDAVIKTTSILQNYGYSVFDENCDGDGFGASRAENCISLMSKSHRAVVFMSTQYINNHWSVYTLQKALERMIEAKLKIIFIMLPGVKEYINQHSKEDSTCRMIKHLIKLNRVIFYSSETNFDTNLFELKLEYAMPKIHHNKDIELNSPAYYTIVNQSPKNGSKL